MSKIKLTKGELKKQRDSLKQFRRYLPTLQLKKQQLQTKILETRTELEKKEAALKALDADIKVWCGLLADTSVDLSGWVRPTEIKTEIINVAGANVPYLTDVIFATPEYDLYETPFWLDSGLDRIRDFMKTLAEVEILREQIARLEHELRVTTQRVNLFEKIKIPECNDNIRRIRIYLGDQQANAVGISKVAKKKLLVKAEAAEEALV